MLMAYRAPPNHSPAHSPPGASQHGLLFGRWHLSPCPVTPHPTHCLVAPAPGSILPLSNYLKCTEHADFARTPRHLLRRRGMGQAAPPASDPTGAGNPIGLSAEMPPPLEVGDGVVLGGLGSELNDVLGTLMGWHEGRGRWTVKLMSVSKPVLLKPANLRRLTASICRIRQI